MLKLNGLAEVFFLICCSTATFAYPLGVLDSFPDLIYSTMFKDFTESFIMVAH